MKTKNTIALLFTVAFIIFVSGIALWILGKASGETCVILSGTAVIAGFLIYNGAKKALAW